MMRKAKKKQTCIPLVIFRFLLLFGYLVFLAYALFGRLTHMPDLNKDLMNIPMDKIIHFCMFLPFPILFHIAFGKKHEKRWKAILWFFFILILGMTLSAASEIGQSYTEYRTADPADFIADAMAAIIGSLLVFIIDIW